MKNSKGARPKRTKSLFVRLTAEEKQLIELGAHADGETNVSAWVRRLALQRVKRSQAGVDRAS